LLLFAFAAKLGVCQRVFNLIALILLLLGTVVTLVLQVMTIFQSLRSFSQPVVTFLKGCAGRAKKDHEISQRLGGLSASAIRYVGTRLRTEADHLRVRVAVVVGALDKVGLIPLALGTYFTASKYVQDTHVEITSNWEMGVAAFGIFYMLSMLMINVSHRIDELAQVLEIAIQEHELRS
jgi:hypothetical protein